MADIFRAYQPSLGRYIVVKKLRPELKCNAEVVERFRREARALASVLHQNVAHVYDFVEKEKDSFIVMEFIEGVDVSTVIQKVGHLPPVVAACILLGVGKGVSYIHSHHLIHRDIKPSNIRLTTRGEVKIMDFGIVVDEESSSLTRPGIMVGSPSYLSPEQVLGDPITHKADIFLLGISFYEMLTGSKPFKEEAGSTVFNQIRDTHYVAPRQMQSQIPLALERIVRRCLQKKPEHRYPDVRAIIHDLERFLGESKGSHSADVILKYLDEEALLKPSVTFVELKESKQPLFLQHLAAFVVLALLFFFLGFRWGATKKSSSSLPQPTPSKTLSE